jgi:hypothetical protein
MELENKFLQKADRINDIMAEKEARPLPTRPGFIDTPEESKAHYIQPEVIEKFFSKHKTTRIIPRREKREYERLGKELNSFVAPLVTCYFNYCQKERNVELQGSELERLNAIFIKHLKSNRDTYVFDFWQDHFLQRVSEMITEMTKDMERNKANK